MPRPPRGIALLGLGLNILVACRMGLTNDEGGHLAYGDAILRGMPERPNLSLSSKMPVTALNSAPRMLGELLSHRRLAPGLVRILQALRTARMATVASAFCLSLLVFSFAVSLYGRVAGLFAQLLFVLSPIKLSQPHYASGRRRYPARCRPPTPLPVPIIDSVGIDVFGTIHQGIPCGCTAFWQICRSTCESAQAAGGPVA